MRADLFLISSAQYFRNESAAVMLGMASSSRMRVVARLLSEAILALFLHDTTGDPGFTFA